MRWPGLKNIRQTEMHKGYLSVEELIDVRVNCKKELPHLLAQMSEKYYHNGSDEFLKEKLKFHGNRPFQCFLPFRTVFHEGFLNNEIFDMEEFNFLVYPPKTTHHLNYYLVMDELTSLNDRWKSVYKDNLTNIYYGRILLTYLRHHYLENVWEEFINRPPKHQLLEELLEEVITFIIQWFHPEKNVSCSHIDMDLDNIAQQVMKLLKVEDPKHPIFSASREQFSSWKYNNIYENQWNNSEGRQIINILFNILLYKLSTQLNCNESNQEVFEEDRWMDRLLHLVEECLSISQTLYMTGKEDVFKFVDELEKRKIFLCKIMGELGERKLFKKYLEKLNTPTPINSCQLGEYFSEFQGTYYIPNKMLATEYPDDPKMGVSHKDKKLSSAGRSE
ncbi:hypothetical protein X777_00515 [Ooceraea biroi]|uniref:Uncharacterized protein n=1 Tax=Ooceraea biroi TaxID=2015173 RepID=A0A026WQZ7_OOCBI|nr:hypothetical protein X777_00515 [Ooceraea biroi]